LLSFVVHILLYISCILRDPTCPGLIGAVPDLWALNSSALVSRKMQFGTPNVPDFSKS